MKFCFYCTFYVVVKVSNAIASTILLKMSCKINENLSKGSEA